MTALVFVVAALAGGVAAAVRYLVTLALAGRGTLPWAILVVNTVGSALGGVVIGLSNAHAASADIRLILVGGVAGGLTTFSTWTVDTVQLARGGKWRIAFGNVALGLVVGLAAAAAGYWLAVAVS
jgi:CrcB protein